MVQNSIAFIGDVGAFQAQHTSSCSDDWLSVPLGIMEAWNKTNWTLLWRNYTIQRV